jgi:hypothetical protein
MDRHFSAFYLMGAAGGAGDGPRRAGMNFPRGWRGCPSTELAATPSSR